MNGEQKLGFIGIVLYVLTALGPRANFMYLMAYFSSQYTIYAYREDIVSSCPVAVRILSHEQYVPVP